MAETSPTSLLFFIGVSQRCPFRNDIAFLASLLLLSGFEVHRAAMASRVDMVLTCFIVLAMLQLYRWWELGLKGIPIWAILFMSIATLTKGPVGIVLPCAVIGIFLLFQKVSVWKAFYKIIPIALLSCILPLLWYYAAYQQVHTSNPSSITFILP